MKSIAYYITAHGYGHGARSCDILNSMCHMAPELPIIVTTDLSRDFLNSRLRRHKNISFRPGAFDIGLIQKDSIQSDIPKTLEELEKLEKNWESLIAQEEQFIKQNNIDVVVADIPAIPLAAAKRAKIANIAIGNFSWDWIYESYIATNQRWEIFVDKFREIYSKTDLLLRLPFAPPMDQFPFKKDIPLLAKPGINCREKIAIDLAADASKLWVLLSFTSLDLNPEALDQINELSEEYEFFCVEPLSFQNSSIRSISRDKFLFSDILASCDVIISKPGFGLVSECIVNNKPMIYSDRGEFAEYPYLVEGIEKYLKNVYMPSACLYSGAFLCALEKIKKAPAPQNKLEHNGTKLVANEILSAI